MSEFSNMDGKNMRAGAVASVSSKIKNPITAAKLLLETSDNVMFVGENAEKFRPTNTCRRKFVNSHR